MHEALDCGPRNDLGAVATGRDAHAPVNLDPLLTSWEQSLRAANRRPAINYSSRLSAKLLIAFLKDSDRSLDVELIERADVEAFIVHELERGNRRPRRCGSSRSSSSSAGAFEKGEIDRSPMEAMPPPSLPESPVRVLSDDTIRALLTTCAGREVPRWRFAFFFIAELSPR